MSEIDWADERAAWEELAAFFDEHHDQYNLSLGLEYSTVVDWVADITPRRGHPKAREYPLWRGQGFSRAQALRRSMDDAREAIAVHRATLTDAAAPNEAGEHGREVSL